jgi:hypothetical protein
MHAECPLCGRERKHVAWESIYSSQALETAYQIRNLQKVINGLCHGDECVSILQEERHEMCPFCQSIIGGLGEDYQCRQLISRIHFAIATLEKQ